MGKYELLGCLTVLRVSGDDRFYRYEEIRRLLLKRGVGMSYPNVWRGMNELYSDGFVEARFGGKILHRKVAFRARVPSILQTSHMKTVDNTYRTADQTSGNDTQKGELAEVGKWRVKVEGVAGGRLQQ